MRPLSLDFSLFVMAALFICMEVSCNKLIDSVQPSDQVNANTVFASVSNLQEGVLGVYTDWREEYMFQIGALMSDECKPSLQNYGANGTGVNLFRWAYSSLDPNVTNAFLGPYQVINRTNLILSSINSVPAQSNADQLTRQQLKGELLAIRAFEHFELYRTFANASTYNASSLAVPYITSTNILNKPSRPTTAAFFLQMQQDISQADSLIAPGNNDVTRMNQTALFALKARIALYTGNWSNAITFSTQAINNVPLAGISDFPNIWTDQSDAEVIFKIKKTNQSPTYPEGVFINVPQDIVLFTPSNKLINAYDSADIRPASYFTFDSSLQSAGQNPPYLVTKYAGTYGQQDITDEIVLRTAEMYLIRAEAYAQQGNITAGESDLNALRSNRIKNYVPQSFNGSSTLLAAILTERFKELAFEGHRYYDLRRLGYSIQRQANDLQYSTDQSTLASSNTAYILPIPQQEVLANPNILPNNTGW